MSKKTTKKRRGPPSRDRFAELLCEQFERLFDANKETLTAAAANSSEEFRAIFRELVRDNPDVIRDAANAFVSEKVLKVLKVERAR
jgi:hypothetical protein